MNKVLINGVVVKKMSLPEKKVTTLTIVPLNEPTDKTNFIKVKAFAKKAEFINERIQVKERISIEGHLISSVYEKEGKKVFSQDICIDNVEFLERKKPADPADEVKDTDVPEATGK